MSKQVLDSVDSLSNPSEPPNIGNWYSSYTYESPVLSGIDENVASQGDIQSSIKVWRASDNISFSSELLDSNDCFSSFVPETPALADSDDFRVPESIDIGFKEDTSTKGCKEDSDSKEEDNSAENQTNGKSDSVYSGVDVASKGLLQCTNSVADNKRDVNSNDMSLASEPPDIQNWFSSYVYESPKVDTIQNFVLPYHEKEFDDKVYMNEYNGCGEPQNLRNSLGSSFIHDDKYEHLPVSKIQEADGTNNTTVTKEMSRERISQQTLYHKKPQNSKCGSPRYTNKVIKDSKTTGEHLETISPQEANCKVSCIINHSSCEGEKLYRHPIHRMNSEENSPKSEDCVEPAYNVQPKNSPVARVLSQKLSKREAGEIMDKEDNINGLGENGFRSTRKNRNSQLHNGSPLPRPSAVQSPFLSGITVASNRHKHVLTRKVLTETTNLHPTALETTGKWSCPQRTKPDLGPPLKQLRLEQWVRRA
ncbi:uncharacterized protein [Nicotiana sylvestris]|uniref:Uncharacterized protein LOC104222664 isoform X2 n=1 Tax=Nicotiana sylvestris TaxID=4096 RepID=A0A1U7WDC6_NICSY|nr:PREDICTED: uncharacterized protein LOC104222664 isoform X2 [Nicotiana sylvestris]